MIPTITELIDAYEQGLVEATGYYTVYMTEAHKEKDIQGWMSGDQLPHFLDAREWDKKRMDELMWGK